MQPPPEEAKRDVVLAPGEYAYMQDSNTGAIKTSVGPTVISQTGQLRPARFDPETHRFSQCRLDQAVVPCPRANEGDYVILENPTALNSSGQQATNEFPPAGGEKPSPQLAEGSRIVIRGPWSEALWPGQRATVIPGHHLRSNEYLIVQVYNEQQAKQNWDQGVMKAADSSGEFDPQKGSSEEGKSGDESKDEQQAITAKSRKPADLSMGRQFVIKGTDVAFYIPPTGVEVVKDPGTGEYVREAVTLEQIEYCILVDENGKKRYERGPQVVFPAPTERFYRDQQNNRKFSAIELNNIQGIHIKVIAPYQDGSQEFKEGDELFITGREQAIYFPRPEHSIVTYGDQKKHYATAIPRGEGRYVMNRDTGEIRTEKGPKMLLPDPRNEVIVRRVLTENQCDLWYPGNVEAAAYNQNLRQVMSSSPSGRSGFVSDRDVRRSKRSIGASVPEALMDMAPPEGAGPAAFADEMTRGTQYTKPRTITLDSKYDGAPIIQVWTGYAVLVVDKQGNRRVVEGPATVQLAYDETLEVMELSTGKPKTTDNLMRTVYLRTKNNKISDIVTVHTKDHIPITIKVSLSRGNFNASDNESRNRWFEVENYVKFVCDHVRSMLKGAIRKIEIEEFYGSGESIVRDIVLGKPREEDGGAKHRPGIEFPECGLHIQDVEVLDISIQDEGIRRMLEGAQQEVVSNNIKLSQAEKRLRMTQRTEEIGRQEQQARFKTETLSTELAKQRIEQDLSSCLAELASELEQEVKRKEVLDARTSQEDAKHAATLARRKADAELDAEVESNRIAILIKEMNAEAEAAIKRFEACQGNFAESLLALQSQQTLERVAEALSVQQVIGGKNMVDVVQKMFAGSPLEPLMEEIAERARQKSSGRKLESATRD